MFQIITLAILGVMVGDDPVSLTPPDSLAAFRPQGGQWAFAAAVAPRAYDPRLLQGSGSKGDVLFNGPAGRTANLVTLDDFADVEFHAEFLVPKGSNSGVKFNAHYEIQIADSFGKDKPSASDCGGVYPRAELLPTYHHIDKGFPPSQNACLEPGAWQTLDVVFRSPRFDAGGKKVANARFEKVVLNGKTIHENLEVPYPTGHAWRKPEVASGPIMLQGDHGPVAFRNVRVKKLERAGSGQ